MEVAVDSERVRCRGLVMLGARKARHPEWLVAERARQAGWTCQIMVGGHFVFVTLPAELSALLVTQSAA